MSDYWEQRPAALQGQSRAAALEQHRRLLQQNNDLNYRLAIDRNVERQRRMMMDAARQAHSVHADDLEPSEPGQLEAMDHELNVGLPPHLQERVTQGSFQADADQVADQLGFQYADLRDDYHEARRNRQATENQLAQVKRDLGLTLQRRVALVQNPSPAPAPTPESELLLNPDDEAEIQQRLQEPEPEPQPEPEPLLGRDYQPRLAPRQYNEQGQRIFTEASHYEYPTQMGVHGPYETALEGLP